MLVNQQFAAELHRTGNPYEAFRAVNPYADAQDVQQAADRLITNPATEADMLAILMQEKLQVEAQLASQQEVTLLTIAQQRAVLARIISGQHRTMRHVRLRNVVVEAYDAPTIPQIMQAIALDRRLAKEQRGLQAAIAAEYQPERVSLAPQVPPVPAPAPAPVPATAPEPQPQPQPQQPETQPEPQAALATPFIKPDPGYEPIYQKIARWKQEEQNLTVEQRLQQDYEAGEAYKAKKREERRNKKLK